jgi:hypothetical protein
MSNTPPQVFTVSVGSGSWRAIVDGKNNESQDFEGSWSGPVSERVEFLRHDVVDRNQPFPDPAAPA